MSIGRQASAVAVASTHPLTAQLEKNTYVQNKEL
jgi:hypothetical protein